MKLRPEEVLEYSPDWITMIYRNIVKINLSRRSDNLQDLARINGVPEDKVCQIKLEIKQEEIITENKQKDLRTLKQLGFGEKRETGTTRID